MSDIKERAKEYYDIDGNKVELDTLCRKEPAWAANVIRTLQSQLTAAQGEVERLKRTEQAISMVLTALVGEGIIAHQLDRVGDKLDQLAKYSDAVEVEGWVKYDPFESEYYLEAPIDYDSDLAKQVYETRKKSGGQRVKVLVKGE